MFSAGAPPSPGRSAGPPTGPGSRAARAGTSPSSSRPLGARGRTGGLRMRAHRGSRCQVGRAFPADLSELSAEGAGCVKVGPSGPAAGGPGGATVTGSDAGATGQHRLWQRRERRIGSNCPRGRAAPLRPRADPEATTGPSETILNSWASEKRDASQGVCLSARGGAPPTLPPDYRRYERAPRRNAPISARRRPSCGQIQ
jgi:hypothetical protein